MGKQIIVAHLHSRVDERPLGVVTLRGAELEMSGVEDVGYLVRLHLLFLSPRRTLRQSSSGESELLFMQPKTPLHFLSCLEQIESEDINVVLETEEV